MTPNEEQQTNERIEAVGSHIENAVKEVAPQATPKHALSRRIVNIFKTDFESYYRKHPSRALDQRSIDNEEWITAAVRKVIDLLDEYEISDKTR